MSLQEVTAKVTKGDRAGIEYSAKIDLPDNLDEARSKYGDEVVFSRFMASLVIDIQSFMRSQITKDNATPETVAQATAEWSPGVKRRGKTVVEKLQELLSGLTEEERLALLADMRG